jgi:ubiquinone/menaquinone biosynthesis C-methylase UbiE
VSATDFDARAATWDEDPRKHARAQAVADAIVRRLDLPPQPRTLEYGAGTGLLSFALADRLGETVLADTSTGMLEVASRKIEALAATRFSTRVLDLTQHAAPTAQFDLICSMMTLHHIPDTQAILRAFRQMLVRSGQLAVADLDAEDGSFHGPDVDVHHGFQRAALANLARSAGFADVQIETCFEMKRGGRSYPVFLLTARAA